MANPIIPSGNRRRVDNSISLYEIDIAEAARRQDIERRIREDNDHFERTGENRSPVSDYSPLVDDDRPNVVNDGDSYDENNHTVAGEYVEDSPSRIIDPDSIRRRENSFVDNVLSIPKEREAYFQREKIKEDKVFKEKVDNRKKKFNNSIAGLAINED